MNRIFLPNFAQMVDGIKAIGLTFLLVSTCCVSGVKGQTVELEPAVAEAFGLTKGQIVSLNVSSTEAPTAVVREHLTIDGVSYALELFPHSLRSPKFAVREQVGDGQFVNFEPAAPRTIRGSLIGSKGSRVFGSITESGLSARMRMGDGKIMYIEPLATHVKGIQAGTPQAKQHVIYSERDTVPHAGTCGIVNGPQQVFEAVRMAEQRMRDGQNNSGTEGPTGPNGPEGPGNNMVAELALDADFEYFQDYGTVQATIDRMELVINIVNDQYESEVDITHEISGIVVRSNPNDPYTSTDAVDLLTEFRTEWINNQQAIPRDVAHLFTGKQIDGNTIGIANAIGGICTSVGFCLSQSDFSNALVCVTDLTAHELGHLWNGSHCTCPNHTMNPSITCANTFNETETVPSIIAHRNSRNCLSFSNDAPGNDNWESKFALGSLPATVTGTNINATVQADEQQLTETGATAWWFVVAPGDGIMSVDTAGSNFDTQLHIFTGNQNGFANLQPLVNNDDNNGTAQSSLSFPVEAGERYEIRVGGFSDANDTATGQIQLSASFAAQGPTDFFWSDRNVLAGANNDSNARANFLTGSSGSVYLYYDPTASDIDTGAFFDISTSQPGVIEFTAARTLEFTVNVGTTPIGVRWGDGFGKLGDVTSDFIDEIGAVNIVGGNGMLALNTGPVFLDEGFDADANGFLFARVDFNVIGPPGSTVDIIAIPGMTGIVHMSSTVEPGVGSMSITVTDELPPTTDFFWSASDLNEGAVNDSMAAVMFNEGESGSLYIYYDSLMSELDTGAFLNIQTSSNGVVEFTNAATLDFDITANGTPFTVRWGDSAGETGLVMPNSIQNLGAFTIVEGTGILDENTGPVLLDQGYDPFAQAFLFARVDFDVVGTAGDMVDFSISSGDQGIVHNNMLLEPTFGRASVMISDFLLGDVDCDGAVTLLDVQPFIDLISNGEFSAKGDINGDGVVDLLDVAGFVDLLSGG